MLPKLFKFFKKIKYSVLFPPHPPEKKNKTFKFLNFFLGRGAVQTQRYSILGMKKQPPPLAPFRADRSFIIGTEMV